MMMESESYVVVGVVIALWFVRELFPVVIKAAKSLSTPVVVPEPRVLGASSAGSAGLVLGPGGGSQAGPVGDTGQHKALSDTGSHDLFVTQREFRTFQEAIKEDHQATDRQITAIAGQVTGLQTAMTKELRLLTRAVGRIEGAQSKRG